MRAWLVLLHRYVGLAIALFLVVAGLTGALLAFYDGLDVVVNAKFMHIVPPSADAKPLSPLVLRERVQQQFPNIWVNRVPLATAPNLAVNFYLRSPQDPEHQHTTSYLYDDAFVNPYTGEVLVARKWGDISQGWINLIPFIYRLHYSLALGDVGSYLFGIAALLWTLDCFVGAYLTFPAKRCQISKNTWLLRWKKAWQVRWRANAFKLNFDLHRAGGLWVWAMLLVFAWSSVGFNLTEVYNPAMGAVFKFQDGEGHIPSLAKPKNQPDIVWQQALPLGEKLMDRLAQTQGFEVITPYRLIFNPYKNMYQYIAKTSRDISEKSAQTTVYFDATTGKQLAFYIPSQLAAGDTVGNWLYFLHTAKVWGLPFQLFICLMGLIVVMLSATGGYIWLKKRVARS